MDDQLDRPGTAPDTDRIDAAGALGSIADLLDRIAETQATVESEAELAQRGANLLAALTSLRRVREEIAEWEPRLIAAARSAGVSWAQIAPALGVASRQAAERRYLRLNPTSTTDQTAEGRVRAVRGERAGERAVSAWARENASEIRQVAGLVSGAQALSVTGQRHASDVRNALAADDPALLLPLLREVGPHLRAAYPQLADHIDAITGTAQHHRDAARAAGHPGPESSPGSP